MLLQKSIQQPIIPFDSDLSFYDMIEWSGIKMYATHHSMQRIAAEVQKNVIR